METVIDHHKMQRNRAIKADIYEQMRKLPFEGETKTVDLIFSVLEPYLRTIELVDKIGSEKMLRVERWHDDFKAWRAGIEWYGENEYEFIVEKPTLLEALEVINQYLEGKL